MCRLNVFKIILIPLILLFSFSCIKKEKTNLIILSIEGLNTKSLKKWGGNSSIAPEINRLSDESHVFLKANTTSPSPLPANISLFTSLYPKNHKVISEGANILSKDFITLTEVLKEKKYETSAVISNAGLSNYSGIERGFINFDDCFGGEKLLQEEDFIKFNEILGYRTSNETLSKIQKLIEVSKKPFFIFCQFSDLIISKEYNKNLSELDKNIGNLISFLKNRKLYEDTIIVLFSNSAVCLDEDCKNIKDKIIKVPLIIKPAKTKDKLITIDKPVSLIDISPTVLKMLNISNKKFEKQIEGTDILNHNLPKRDILYEENASEIEGADEIIHLAKKDLEEGNYEEYINKIQMAFNLNQNNIKPLLSLLEFYSFSKNNKAIEKILNVIKSKHGNLPYIIKYEVLLMKEAGEIENAFKFLNEMEEKFGTIPEIFVEKINLLNEKEKVIKEIEKFEKNTKKAWFLSMLKGIKSSAQNNLDDSLFFFNQAIKEGTTLSDVYLIVGRFYKNKRDIEMAAKYLRTALYLSNFSPECLYEWGDIMAIMQNFEAAKEAFRRVLFFQPEHLSSKINLLRIYWIEKNKAESSKIYREIMAKNPDLVLYLLRTDKILQEIHNYFLKE